MAQLNDLLITGKTRALNPINGSCTNGTTVTTQTQSTKFMREDGTWSAPSYTAIGTTSTTAMAGDTNVNNVTQTPTDTGNYNYELLFSGTADNTTRTEGTRKSNTLLYNPSKNELSIQGSLTAQDGITSNGTISLKDPSNASHNNIEMSYNIISLYDTSSGVDRMMITHSDIEFDSSNTPNTWDGTNTSLKTAVTNAKDTVKQTNTYTGSSEYKLLFSGTADSTDRTEGVRKHGALGYAPGDNILSLYNNALTTVIRLQANDSPSLFIKDSSTKKLTLTNTDITLTDTTWDGTNTSLKTALANKISKETNTTVSWTSSATGRTVTFVLAKIGTIVICNMAGSTDANHSFTAWTQTQLGVGQIPAGYRPSSAIEGRISTQTGGAVVIVNTVGTVAMQTWSNLGGQMAFGGTFWWKTS